MSIKITEEELKIFEKYPELGTPYLAIKMRADPENGNVTADTDYSINFKYLYRFVEKPTKNKIIAMLRKMERCGLLVKIKGNERNRYHIPHFLPPFSDTMATKWQLNGNQNQYIKQNVTTWYGNEMATKWQPSDFGTPLYTRDIDLKALDLKALQEIKEKCKKKKRNTKPVDNGDKSKNTKEIIDFLNLSGKKNFKCEKREY